MIKNDKKMIKFDDFFFKLYKLVLNLLKNWWFLMIFWSNFDQNIELVLILVKNDKKW